MISKVKTTISTLSIFSIILIISLGSCKKDNSFAEGDIKLKFSTDTIIFDTLFTTIGSSTYSLKVSNTENKIVNISQIHLAGGQNSNFRINIDGIAKHRAENIEIPANDSIYIFVEVTVDPNSTTEPMLITDSIIFETNNNLQDVDLVAYGRDAYFILPNKYIDGLPPFNIVAGEYTDTTWTNDKPIVIYGYAVIDSNATLRIEEGTEIYLHNSSGIWVYKGGCIKVNGSKDNPVLFQGDRPEKYYEDIPGQWDRIWINEGSVDNEINYAIIRNGFIGIQAELLQQSMGNSVKIRNTIIENMSGIGILSKAHTIYGENLLITNCKQFNLALTMGGKYEFKHSTFANYWSYDIRQTPAVYINDYYKEGNSITLFNLYQANFYNCIIYGNNDEEIILDKKNNNTQFNYLFDHNLIKTENDISDNNHWKSIIVNKDPAFISIDKSNYHLTVNSSAIEKGKGGVEPTTDLDGVIRDVNTPEIGAYEYVE